MNEPDADAVHRQPGAYREYLAETARALYAAARTENALALDDVDLALSGRRAVLDLLTAVHASVTGLQVTNASLHPSDFEANPVEALGRALRRYPRPPGELAPTDVALAAPVSPSGAAWQQVARAAAVAHHAWTSGVGEPLGHDEQWAAIADVACLADTLTRLDVGLVMTLASDRNRAYLTSVVRGGLNQALGVAARETLRVASRGPLPDTVPDRVPLPALNVLPVRSVADLPAAQHQLAVLLQHGGLLRPERFPTLAAVNARACLLLADGLGRSPSRRAGDRPALDVASVQTALRRHAAALQEATLRVGGIASVVPGDARPMRQAAEIDRCLQQAPDAVTADQPLLTSVVNGIAGTTRALATASSRALHSGDWLIAEQGDSVSSPLWRRRRPGDLTPSPIAAIRRAAASSVQLTQVVTPLVPRASSHPRATTSMAVIRMQHAGSVAQPLGAGRMPASLLTPPRPLLPGHAAVPGLARPTRRR